ncbi:MAG TPA: hypothetical protein VGJ84_22485, partial [Polyangiaceae bacterium]
ELHASARRGEYRRLVVRTSCRKDTTAYDFRKWLAGRTELPPLPVHQSVSDVLICAAVAASAAATAPAPAPDAAAGAAPAAAPATGGTGAEARCDQNLDGVRRSAL